MGNICALDISFSIRPSSFRGLCFYLRIFTWMDIKLKREFWLSCKDLSQRSNRHKGGFVECVLKCKTDLILRSWNYKMNWPALCIRIPWIWHIWRWCWLHSCWVWHSFVSLKHLSFETKQQWERSKRRNQIDCYSSYHRRHVGMWTFIRSWRMGNLLSFMVSL